MLLLVFEIVMSVVVAVCCYYYLPLSRKSQGTSYVTKF